MEVLREFLESSTIHGLTYISTAKVSQIGNQYFITVSQTKAGKFCWFLVVCLGFTGAGYLIHTSYSDWQKSPVSTSISTKPISELEFPTVTVCPPKDSHTALNYDLMRADNQSLTEQDSDHLKEAVYNTIIEPSHQEFIRLMLATVNPENVRKTVE